jgi:NADH dehydrogenase
MNAPQPHAAERNIVIVGGGFAGTTLAQRLERLLPPPWRVVLVSQESYTTFNPMLAEVVGASVFPEHVIAPIRQMVGRTRFIMATVTGVDFKRRLVAGETLAGPREIHYEHLVFAFGTRANLSIVPGMAEHALPLKLVGDAMFIRNRILQRVARIELESDPETRRRLGHFVVVGGGFSGVEVAGELADFLASARRFYPRVAKEELAVSILQDADRLLPELPECLGRAAERSMTRRGIRVRLAARAASVEAGGVTLASGEFIASATVICTIGTKPNPVVERLGVPTQRGRIETGPDMALKDLPGLWAIGDCALVTNGRSGQFSPPTILQNERNLPLSARQTQCVFLLVLHDQHSPDTERGMFGGPVMGVRVVPVRACPVLNREVVLVAVTSAHRQARVPIRMFGRGQSMPVQDQLVR